MSDTYIEVRTQVRMAQWQNIIKECRESGMTVSEFCEERSISSHAYYYWLRKIREYITEADTSPKFVQLPAAFVEALPENIEHPDETIPGRVIKEMGRLFKIEQDCQEISAEERQKQREKEAKPILLALFEYLEKEQGHVPQSSKLSKAINYCLSHRNELMNYLRDGDCSISNNLAERSIRPFTIGRKNWVFSGSPAGAEASAAAYSLIETCIANKVDTKEYLEYIFTNMSQEESLKDDSVLEKYLPWNVNLPTEE